MTNSLTLVYDLVETIEDDEQGEWRFFKSCLLIDGIQFDKDHCLDLAELVESTNCDWEFDILTCGCGSPDCVGIYNATT